MIKLFLNIFNLLSPHRKVVYAVVSLLLLLCGVSAFYMNYDEDIAAFMPLDEQTAKYSEVFGNLGGQDKIVVIFDNKANENPEDKLTATEAAMDAFGQAVALHDTAHIVQNLQIQMNEMAMLGVLQTIGQTYPALLTAEDYQRLDSLMATDGYLKNQMEQNKLSLMLPTGAIMAQSIPYDPLHLSTEAVKRLRGLNVSDTYQTIDGYLFKDSIGIALLESPFGISESRNNQRLQQVLGSCISDVRSQYENISVSAVGAPLIAVTNATQIKSDSLLAVGLSVIIILLILLYSFRRVGDLAWIGVSVFVGWLFALGAIALMRDGISLIVIGIGSVIIGIAVNYPLHFIDHLKHETDMREVLKEMVPPLLVGNITTVSAFLCLVFLDAQAMRDLGLFGSLTLIGTILFVLICLPVMVKPRKEKASTSGRIWTPGKLSVLQDRRIKRIMPWLIAGLTLVFGYFSTGTSFDSNMQNINYMTAEQREGLKFLSSSMQSRGDNILTLYAVAEGKTLDEALQHNEVLVSHISDMNGVEKVVGIAGLIPSDSLYTRRMNEWKAFWNRHSDISEQFGKVAEETGFSADAFLPFETLMKHPPLSPNSADLTQSPLYRLIGHNFIMQSQEGGYKVVNFVSVAKQDGEALKEKMASHLPDSCFVFSQADVSNHLAEVLSDSFNYIGFVCGLVVFIFLWLSFRSIELSLMSFLPLAVSWIWILGIMQIFGMQFNIVNIILATFIFGQGDDYTIFITEGLMYEYTTGKRYLEKYKNSIALSAIIMFVGIGTLIFSKHPAMRSLAEVAIVGMITVVIMAYYLPPLIFRWLTQKNGVRREYPITLSRLGYSLFSISFFLFGMYALLIPYTFLLHRPLQKIWKGEGFYHWLLQRVSSFVIHRVPGVKFTEVNKVGETFRKPAVIVCNHQSHLDLMCIMQLSPKIIVLTNDWVWNNPFYGMVIHTAEFYPVSNGYDQNFPQLQDLVKRGYSIVVFPEGTRTPDGKIGRFHKGAFTLAQALGIDILPLCLHGAYDVLPKHDFMLRRGHITLEVCKRISADSLSSMNDREATSTVHRWYIDKYAAMRRELETPEYEAPYVAYRNKYKVNIS
ncbi:MAG: 1-acyl-sn-glycerol-3-phosphate acyltransferase [Bacteroides sp.]|nr:1-acyl-sn-glycerol-3-phosphate acyltransferase [Bacteroides sp.]